MAENKPIPPRLRPQLSRVFNTQEDAAQPSPPYHPSATFTGGLELPPQESPAYRSTATLHMPQPEVNRQTQDADRKDTADTERPTVQFPPDVKRAPSVHIPSAGMRHDTMTSSRASSLAGTDDEDNDEDYDWSGEEDLVDEEAKFEQKMGIKQKPKGWGFKRYVKCVSQTWRILTRLRPGLSLSFSPL